MLPSISIGPFRFWTYGIFVALALLAASSVLRRDSRVRELRVEPYYLMTMVALAGVVGAKLWHCLEHPVLLWAHPGTLFHSDGFAFAGGLAAGAITLACLAHSHRIPMLRMMDIVSAPATIGYAIGRIGCLVSGDGCYGIPTRLPWGMTFPHGFVPTTQHVHPTPIYETIVALGVFYYLWSLRRRGPDGLVFSVYLILTGCSRFLVEFIRINPRVLFGLSNAQLASMVLVLLGCFLYRTVRRTHNARQPLLAQPRAVSESIGDD